MNNKIKIERVIKGLTQEELAKKVAVIRQTINATEAYKYIPSTVLALKVARIFDNPVKELFILDEND